MNVSVILVRPEHPGNVGAVARIMANFGFTQLVLVDPVADHTSEECKKRAKHAQDVLKKAVVVDALEDADCDWLIGTSGKLGSDYNLPRLPLAPWQLAGRITAAKKKVGIVFGPESSGLLNEEVEGCDVFVSIPANPKYPIINLSHSVSIILYELFIASLGKPVPFTPIGLKDKEVLTDLIDETLDTLPFETEEKRKTQKMLWHRLIGKSFLTRREAFGLMGFFKKVLKKR